MCLSSLTVLCVCTYRRPANLLKLLNALVELEQPGELQVVVVDNHEDRQGMGVCKQLPDSYPFIVHAFAESRPGITYARNTALREALALKPQYLAFLDDDEWPSQQWLREMRNTMQLHDSDVVGGPTLTQFPDHAPLEYRDNPYFGADMRLKDGQKCQLQAAGNAFMRADFVRVLAPDFFHPAFANSCGEDLAFFTQLSDHGAKMHWSANAVVHESVEPYRLSEEWLKSRVITVANSVSCIH